MLETITKVATCETTKVIAKTIVSTFAGAICAGLGKAIIKQNEDGFVAIYKLIKKEE